MRSDSIEIAVNYIEKYNRFYITPHIDADADALGAAFALASLMGRLGKNSVVYAMEAVENRFSFLDGNNEFELYCGETSLPDDIGERAVIGVDTGPEHLSNVFPVLMKRVKDFLFIDHHINEEENQYTFCSDHTASSTCELIYELYAHFGYTPSAEEAQAIYAGIMYDTGCFVYPNTTAKTIEIVAELIRIGVSPIEAYHRLYCNKPLNSLRFYSDMTTRVQYTFDGRFAELALDREERLRVGISFGELRDIVNYPLQSRDVLIAAFYRERDDGKWSCSLRSKGRVNCYGLAKKFNGGGHRNSAGFITSMLLVEVQKRVSDAVAEVFRGSVK